MNYKLLGWINVVILCVIISPYLLNFLNKKFFKTKNKNYFDLVKLFRKLHKPLGLALMIFGIVHGYMALGGFRLHTGSVFFVSILITGSLGGAFYKTKKKVFFKWHKRMALLSVIMFLLHFFAPSALFYLLK